MLDIRKQRQIDIFIQRRISIIRDESHLGNPTLQFICHKIITETLLDINNKNKVLDLGCFQGKYSYWLADRFKTEVIGIDILEPEINDAFLHREKKVKFCVADIEVLPFKPELFDFTFCFDVLEHITNKNKSLKDICRVLKDKGKLLIHMPVIDNYLSFSYFLELSFPKTTKSINERLGHFSENFLTLRQLVDLLINSGFKCDKIIYTDAFFVPMVDFLVGLLGAKVKKIFLVNNVNKSKLIWFFSFKRIYSLILIQILRPLIYIDMLLSKLGIKSGVYIIATKSK